MHVACAVLCALTPRRYVWLVVLQGGGIGKHWHCGAVAYCCCRVMELLMTLLDHKYVSSCNIPAYKVGVVLTNGSETVHVAVLCKSILNFCWRCSLGLCVLH